MADSSAGEKRRTRRRQARQAVSIQKYANRRLYNKATSSYITLDDLAAMVRQGVDFVVYDAKSGEDITRKVLTQIIFEEEGRGENLLPIQFLRQLIGFYGDRMQAFLPSFLELSLDSFIRQQDASCAGNGRSWAPRRRDRLGSMLSTNRSARTWRCSTRR